MFKFLLILVLIIVLAPLLIFGASIFGLLFRPSRRNRRETGSSSQRQDPGFKPKQESEKVFSDSEGEYVEFEEVEDDKKDQ